jgi:hypothetical protein
VAFGLWPGPVDNCEMEPTIGAVAKALGSEAGEVATKEAQSFLSKVLSEPAIALGGLLADKINARRHRNLIPIVLEANKRLHEAGLEPKAVPLKIIHPLLESASLEEEPELQKLWANLLSNAADPRHTNRVLPIFISMLNSLTTSDAKFLDALYDARNVKQKVAIAQSEVDLLDVGISERQLQDIGCECGVIPPYLTFSPSQASEKNQYFQDSKKALHRMVDTLRRNGIVKEATLPLPVKISKSQIETGSYEQETLDIDTEQEYTLTQLGIDFIRACRAPQ